MKSFGKDYIQSNLLVDSQNKSNGIIWIKRDQWIINCINGENNLNRLQVKSMERVTMVSSRTIRDGIRTLDK